MTEDQRSMMCVILKRHTKNSEQFKLYKKYGLQVMTLAEQIGHIISERSKYLHHGA